MGVEAGKESSVFGSSTILLPVDYIDEDGIRQRVLLPPGKTDVSEGIPAGMSLDSLFPDCPISFKKRLQDELYAHGLIEPRDFLQPGAAERTRSALLSAVQHDAIDIVNLAREANKK